MKLGFSPFFMDQTKEQDHDQHHHAFSFGQNQQIVSSSSSSACHIFFNSTQYHTAFYHPQLYQPHHQLQDDYYGYHGGSCYDVENNVQNGLKLSLWKKEDEVVMLAKDDDPVKWMKKDDGPVATASITATNVEVKRTKTMKQSSSFETDLSSNSSSYNCNSPIRVCSDCHTTKTPLWRSGPKGPKSLCNACGIRQRKARRAMASAGNGGGGVSDPPRATKVKEKMWKKPSKLGGSKTSNGKKIGFEDFLINLSNKIVFHRVFPQDEKEAAILLMALSSGLVHG